VADDDRALMERLAALEAEVKADADVQKAAAARKEAALVKLREQRAKEQVEKDSLRERQAAIVKKQSKREEPAPARKAAVDDDEEDDEGSNLASAIELAGKANKVKKELARKGAKSWWKSGLASLALGPLGWLYAGSFRESIPASVVWLAAASLLSKIALPAFLLMPILLISLPLSAIAGIMYAVRFNKTGKRQRLFDNDRKALPEKSAK
jgi:hypothetical protein